MNGLDFELYSYSYGPNHLKTELFKMVASLDHFIFNVIAPKQLNEIVAQKGAKRQQLLPQGNNTTHSLDFEWFGPLKTEPKWPTIRNPNAIRNPKRNQPFKI